MMLSNLLYASTSCLAEETREDDFARLVEHAVARNRTLGMTGAIMLSGTRFAQLLEGPSEPLRQLIRRISIDPRHTGFVILLQGPISERRFDHFAMAYVGRSLFVSRNVDRLVAQESRGSEPEIEALLQLMKEFSR